MIIAIEPTDKNLDIFFEWKRAKNENRVFFGDLVETGERFKVTNGNTVFVPSGWILASYTEEDTIMVGGLFLHSFDVPMQLKITRMEEELKVNEQITREK